jgi:hypothetical protein
MNDRVYILLIICLIALGIYSYQKALHDHGGVTLLDQFIDGKGQEVEQERTYDGSMKYFEYEQKVDGLFKQMRAMTQEREALLAEEEKGIASLLELNTRWAIELLQTAQTIDAVIDPFFKAQALKYVQDLHELSGIIENEIDFFSMNINGSDFQFQESAGFLDEKIGKLLEKADQLDLRDLAGVLKDFNTLDLETLKIRKNMQEHIQYLFQRHKTVRQVSIQIIEILKELDAAFAGKLSESYSKTDQALTEQLNVSARTTLVLLQLFERRLGLMNEIVASLAEHKRIDLAAFKEELGIGLAADAAAASAQAALGQAAGGSGQVQLISSPAGDKEALRLQQKKDEELLNTMLKVYGPE